MGKKLHVWAKINLCLNVKPNYKTNKKLLRFLKLLEYEAQRRGPDHRRLHDILHQRGTY